MIAIQKLSSAPGLSLQNVSEPTPTDDEVLVKVKYASICGTDVGIYDWGTWAQNHVTPPRIIGHELVGEIIQIGDSRNEIVDRKLAVGDLVSSETHVFCGHCHQCEIGNKHICENMQLFGISRDGSFAQVCTIPKRTTWKNDPKIPLKWMSVQEPLGNAVHAVDVAQVNNKDILIIGLGPVGLCAGQVAKAMGAAKVVGVDPSMYRRKLGESFGFTSLKEKLETEDLNKFQVVLEMSGHPSGIESAGKAVDFGGTVMAFGLPKAKVELEWGTFFIDKETTVKGIFGRHIWDTWEKTTKLLLDGKINLDPLITHEFELKDFEQAFKVMKSGECGKVLLNVNA